MGQKNPLKFPHSLRSHAIAAFCSLMRNSTSLCSSGHKSLRDLCPFPPSTPWWTFQKVQSGGCFGGVDSERRGEDGMQQRIHYSLGRVVHTGCTWFAAFLYLAAAKVPKGGNWGFWMWRGMTKPLGSFSLGDGFEGWLIKGRPDRQWAWQEALLYWESGGVPLDWPSLLTFVAVLTMGFFCPAQKEDDTFLGLCNLTVIASWTHNMRRNHIYFWVRRNDYKKAGCKKLGLWTEDFL